VHTYRLKVHVEGVGVVEEVVTASTPLDAQHLIERRYAPAKVILYTFTQIS
jgi:hypothetical protein